MNDYSLLYQKEGDAINNLIYCISLSNKIQLGAFPRALFKHVQATDYKVSLSIFSQTLNPKLPLMLLYSKA